MTVGFWTPRELLRLKSAWPRIRGASSTRLSCRSNQPLRGQACRPARFLRALSLSDPLPSGPPGPLSGMTRFIRQQIKLAIADDELWVAKARTLIEPGVDCSSIEQSIARTENDIARMRALV